jgi:AcrR family transcriptional regulator
MPTATRTLSTAEERREAVLEAASRVFARRGYFGTPTMEIAREAGISQAYLFRLFATKEELFVALVDRCHDRVLDCFRRGVARADADDPESVLKEMGQEYVALLMADPELLRNQLHAQSACSEPAIRDATRRGFARLVAFVQEAVGDDDEEVQRFFATGMLINVIAVMEADELDEPWARTLMHKPE